MPQHYKRNRQTKQQGLQLMFCKELAMKLKKALIFVKQLLLSIFDKMTLSRYITKCKTQPQPSVGYAAVTLANYIIPANMKSDLAKHIITV